MSYYVWGESLSGLLGLRNGVSGDVSEGMRRSEALGYIRGQGWNEVR